MADAEDDRLSGGRTIALLALVALFSIPSLLMNTSAHGSAQDLARSALNVGTVVTAPLCIHSAIVFVSKGRALYALMLGVLFAIMLGYNLATALGSIASSRSGFSEARQDTAKLVERFEASRLILARDMDHNRELAQGYSAKLAAQEMATLKTNPLWLRSSGCTNATVQDSIDLCALYRGAEKRQLAAAEAERLKIEIDAIDIQLSAKGPAPAVADPQVANITTLASLVMQVDPTLTPVLLNVYAAIVLELMSAFSPLFLLPLLFGHKRPRLAATPTAPEDYSVPDSPPEAPVIVHISPRGPKRPETMDALQQVALAAAKQLKELPRPTLADPVREFLVDRTRAEVGAQVPTTAMFAAYQGFCEEKGYVALSIHKFSPAMEAHGVRKTRQRVATFHDIEIIK